MMRVKKSKSKTKVTTTALKKAHGAIFIRLSDGLGLGLLPRKCFNVLLHYAQDQGTDLKNYRVDVNEIGNVVGFNSKNIEYLKDTLRGLQGRQVEWDYINDEEKKVWGIASLLSVVQIIDKEVVYSFADEVKTLLLSPRLFCQLDLATQNQFKSEFSLILYEICSRYKTNPGGVTAKLDWMLWRVLLGCDGNSTYSEFFRFKDKVLKPAVAEINEKADITIEPIYFKEGRKVSLLQFKVEQKLQKQLPLEQNDALAATEKKLADLGMSPAQAENLLAIHDDALLAKTADYVSMLITQRKSSPIENITAYFMTILSNGGPPDSSVLAMKQDAEKAAASKAAEVAKKQIATEENEKRLAAIESAKACFAILSASEQKGITADYLAEMDKTNKHAAAAFRTKGMDVPMVRAAFFNWFSLSRPA